MGEQEMCCLDSGAPGGSGQTRDEVWARGSKKVKQEFVLVTSSVPETAPILLLDGE